MLTPVLTMMGLALVCGGALGWAAARLRGDDDPVVVRIDALLPQTQCAQCGYPGCRPYAEAIAAGEAINKCPPGGEATIERLAELLGRDAEPLAAAQPEPCVAFVREAECIGCTLCIQACPVDAIVGAQRLAHTVISDECTGCELCLPPCPVDCIDLIAPPAPKASAVAPERTG